MDELGYRNIWISLAIGWAIAAVGMTLLRHEDDARAAFAMACLVFTVLLRQILDHRKMQELEKDKRRRP